VVRIHSPRPILSTNHSIRLLAKSGRNLFSHQARAARKARMRDFQENELARHPGSLATLAGSALHDDCNDGDTEQAAYSAAQTQIAHTRGAQTGEKERDEHRAKRRNQPRQLTPLWSIFFDASFHLDSPTFTQPASLSLRTGGGRGDDDLAPPEHACVE
jgi:hypothetical protein